MCTIGRKTPVSILQEYLVSIKMTPQYDLIQNGVNTHNPEFVFRVKVGSNCVEGAGRSKQEAKHRAAEKMLKCLKLIKDEPSEEIDDSSDLNGNDLKENFVGLLKEYCIANFYPEPKYFLEEAAGPPHCKIFKMICSVSQLNDFGINKTKKLAKQQAAFKMLERLKGLANENKSLDLTDESFSKMLGTKVINRIPEITLTDEEIAEKYNSVRTIPSTVIKEPIVFYKDYHKAHLGLHETSRTLKKIIDTQYLQESDYLDLVKKIAEELEVNVASAEIPSVDSDSENLILMTMSLVPSVASIGINEQKAAYNLLTSLLLLSQ